MTKQITPAHLRRALEEERRATEPRKSPRSALKQILAKLPAKDLDLRFIVRRRDR